jgi:hypothetical protein
MPSIPVAAMTRSRTFWAISFVVAAALAGGWWLLQGPPQNSSSGPPPDDLPPDIAADPEPHLPPGVTLRFVEVTKAAGIDFRHFDGRTDMQYIMDQTGSGLAWLDYDQDGLMDLFLVQGSTFVGPAPSPAPTCKLYKNLGDGTFTDVSHQAGIDEPNAKALGVVALDFDGDGLIDLFVANDGVPNFLFRNLGGGRFESIGLVSGCAVNLAGRPQAYMGVDADDLDVGRLLEGGQGLEHWRRRIGFQEQDVAGAHVGGQQVELLRVGEMD